MTAPQDARDSSQEGLREREFDEKASSSLAPDNDQSGALSPKDSNRDHVARLTDDLELLRTERLVSNREHELEKMHSSRHRRPDAEDTFNVREEETIVAKKPEESSFLNKIWVKLKKFPRFIRYFLYMLPVAVILLIPILLSIYVFDEGKAPVGGPGGVYLRWFGIWLETMWLSLWAARVCSDSHVSCFPYTHRIALITDTCDCSSRLSLLSFHTFSRWSPVCWDPPMPRTGKILAINLSYQQLYFSGCSLFLSPFFPL